MPQPRAHYLIVGITENAVFIEDLATTENAYRSVTNDAERVVAEVAEHHGRKRIVYRDTEGRWDELKHDNGVFTGFAPTDRYMEGYRDGLRRAAEIALDHAGTYQRDESGKIRPAFSARDIAAAIEAEIPAVGEEQRE